MLSIKQQITTFIYIPPISRERSFKCWYDRKLLVADSSFSKFENSAFITDSKYCQLVFLKWRNHFFQFQENVSQILKESACLYCVLPSKDVAPQNKQLLQFETQLQSGFSGDKHSTSVGRSTLQIVLNLSVSYSIMYVYFLFHHI